MYVIVLKIFERLPEHGRLIEMLVWRLQKQ